MKWSYLIINILTIAGPLSRSFESRVGYWRKWRALFPALGITLLFFIVWDSTFTRWGVWGFTADYLIGWDMLRLPIEEWLFFITVPFACLFIYEVLNYFQRRDWLGRLAPWLSSGLMLLGIGVLIAFWGHFYTVSAFGLMVILLFLQTFVFKAPWLGRFFMAYLVSLVPFVLVNGVLTGAVTDAPIVWYDDAHNLGIRFITIPVDDFAYGLDLMLMNVGLYEWFKGRMHMGVAVPTSPHS